MIETERKFLVNSSDYRKEATSKKRIVQGFLNTDPKRTVRVRIKGNKGYLTIKGISNASGTTRFEWEKEIPINEAEALMKLCEGTVIDKVRFEVPIANHLFEIDEFDGDNKGLVIAEVELSTEDEAFEKPIWLGKEVTGDKRYYNSQLSIKPFIKWKTAF
ncbi:CYTH domain-containing protein [Ascidiimonas sp. W6]|uniref:CYTH domain-containing protein n=1 Tax=Ascidiimonas meishanensis TaxID=3128903 RepID=UPI0030EBE2AD